MSMQDFPQQQFTCDPVAFEQESPSLRRRITTGSLSNRNLNTLYGQQVDPPSLSPLPSLPPMPPLPSSNMSNLSDILRQKPLKKGKASRKTSLVSPPAPSSHPIKKQPPLLTRQTILELLPTRSRGRPTQADKDLRHALKSKKFVYAQQTDSVRHYVDKLMGKKRAGVRRTDRDKRKKSELSNNPEDQSQRGRLLSASMCQADYSGSKKNENNDYNISTNETKAVDMVSAQNKIKL